MVFWVGSSLVMTTDMVFGLVKSKTGENSPFCLQDVTAYFLAALCFKSGTWAAGAAPLGTVEAFDTTSFNLKLDTAFRF